MVMVKLECKNGFKWTTKVNKNLTDTEIENFFLYNGFETSKDCNVEKRSICIKCEIIR